MAATERPVELSLATCQAHNTVPISRALAAYLTDQLGLSVRYRDGDWQESFQAIVAGRIGIGWICSRPYTRLIDEERAPIRLLAAPVMAGARYGGRPIYFSDVIVRRDSRFRQFDDLRGASWAYNEPGSQSGYHITRHYLAQRGERGPFFGRVVGSGAHLRSIEMVLAGAVDASAIDSTVLEWEMARDPTLAKRLRIIEVFGPSPIPPLVISAVLPDDLAADIQALLLSLHTSQAGRQLLAVGNLDRFAAVTDSDYDPIRRMAEEAVNISLRNA